MRLRYTLAALLLTVATASAQIPVPQINLSGNIGCEGFPCVNTGTLQLTSDANHTMTVQETSAFYLKVTSSVSLTATRNLIAPAGRFPFTIENATTGGQSIQIIGASGTGVTIPNGQTVSVWNDGTNFIQIGASQVYPGSGIPNSTGSAWGTSYGTTGTGSVALSVSPTFTGTPIVPTQSCASNTAAANGAYVQNCTSFSIGAYFAGGTSLTGTQLFGPIFYAANQTATVGGAVIVGGTMTCSGATPALNVGWADCGTSISGGCSVAGGTATASFNATGTYAGASTGSSIPAGHYYQADLVTTSPATCSSTPSIILSLTMVN